MKTYRIVLFSFFSLLAFSLPSQAQILKKIGKSVKEVAKAAVSGEDAGDAPVARDAGQDTPATDSKTGAEGAPVARGATAGVDYGKYQVTVVPAGRASEREGEYFIEAYSSVRVRDNQLRTTTVVGIMTEQERLSELGEGSDKDIAIIYENGKKTKETTVGKLDKELLAMNTRYDWYLIKEEAHGGTGNGYIKPDPGKNANEIVFNGKHYGPYMMVSNMIVDRTKTRFYASVSPALEDLENFRTYLVSSDGKPEPIDFGGELLANIDFSNGCTIVPLATELNTRLLKENDESKQQALQEQMTDMMIHHPNKANVIFFNGKKLSDIYVSSPWLDLSGNNIFSVKNDASDGLEAGLYLNGERVASGRPARGQAWSNPEGTNWAWAWANGEAQLYLVFKDGTQIPGVIHPRQVIAGGKSYMVWFGYDQGQSGEIRMFHKAL